MKWVERQVPIKTVKLPIRAKFNDSDREQRLAKLTERIRREESLLKAGGYVKTQAKNLARDEPADIKALEDLLRGKEPMSVSEVREHLAISEKKLREYFNEHRQFYRVGGGEKFDPWRYGLKETT